MPPADDPTQLPTDPTTEPVPSTDSASIVPDSGTSAPEPGAVPDTHSDTTTTTSGEEPTDLMSAVRAVLKSPAEPSPAAGSSAGTPDAQPGPGDGGAPGTVQPVPDQTGATPPKELTEADFADVDKPSVRKRIETLLANRAAARAETETLREPADNWGRHVAFLQQNNISPEDAQNLYGVGSLLGRGDFQGFIAAVRPYWELALRQVGDILPEDLQRRVDEGALAVEDAHEIARARGDASQANVKATLVETRRTQDIDQARVTTVRAALSAWEQGIAQRDPDFALKRDAVNAHAKAIVSERGLPPDQTTAVAWANEAYSAVQKLFQAARPAPRPTASRPNSVAPATRAAPEARTLREAIELAARA